MKSEKNSKVKIVKYDKYLLSMIFFCQLHIPSILIECIWTFSGGSVDEQAAAVISSSHDQGQSEVPSSTPQMETPQTQQPIYAVAFQEQQPERTPSNQQQDQGNVTFECMQTEMINVAEP